MAAKMIRTVNLIFLIIIHTVKVWGRIEYFDLSHPLSMDFPVYPGTRPFTLTKDNVGKGNGSVWYAIYSFCTTEHISTHLDAPYHFNENGLQVDQIPLTHLVNVPLTVVDVREAVNKLENPGDYRITPQDFIEHEKKWGKIKSKSIVIVFTGWSKYWPDSKLYFGSGDVDNEPSFKFPAFTRKAAKWLWKKRSIIGLGIDTASMDAAGDRQYPVHVYLTARNIFTLENVADLQPLLDYSGSTSRLYKAMILPLKIKGGTGGPVRIVAVAKNSDYNEKMEPEGSE